MNNEETSLARLLLEARGWRWATGMKLAEKAVWVVSQASFSDRLTVANDLFGLTCLRKVGARWESMMPGTRFDTWAPTDFEPLPDLTHPATAGHLLDMLWGVDPDAGWHVHGPPGLVCVHRADGSDEHYGDHLGVAVARALIGCRS